MKHGIMLTTALITFGIAIALLEGSPYGELSNSFPRIIAVAVIGVCIISFTNLIGFQIGCLIMRIYVIFSLWFHIEVLHTRNQTYRKTYLKCRGNYRLVWKHSKSAVNQVFKPIWEG